MSFIEIVLQKTLMLLSELV